MPWGAICAVDSKLQFIAEFLKQEESVAELCRMFGITRKTGYKLINRYKAAGLDGIHELSRRSTRRTRSATTSPGSSSRRAPIIRAGVRVRCSPACVASI